MGDQSRKKKLDVFIGSSKEGLGIATAIQLELQHEAISTIWHEGVFGLSEGTLESLVKKLKDFEFAILVLTPDDIAQVRGQSVQIPRDNVLFELGLFMGYLGRERVYAVYCRDTQTKIPSDLAGVTLATFERPDQNRKISEYSTQELLPLIGPAVTNIRMAMENALKKEPVRLSVHYISPTDAYSDYWARLQVRLESEIYKLKNYVWRWNFHAPQGASVQDMYLTFEEVLKKVEPNDVIILVPRQLDDPKFLEKFEGFLEGRSFGKIIFIDQQPPQSLLQSSKIQFVGPDNRKIGILAAFALNKKLKELGESAIYASTLGGRARVEGFIEGMKFFQPGAKVNQIAMKDADRFGNLTLIRHLIKGTPANTPIGIFTGNDETAAAVLRVVDEEKRSQVFVVGCDATKEMIFEVDGPNEAAIATIDTNPDSQARKIAQTLTNGSPQLEEPILYPLDPSFLCLLRDSSNFKALWEKTQ